MYILKGFTVLYIYIYIYIYIPKPPKFDLLVTYFSSYEKLEKFVGAERFLPDELTAGNLAGRCKPPNEVQRAEFQVIDSILN